MEANKEASRGDVVRLCWAFLAAVAVAARSDQAWPVQKQQALVGQMLLEGYGCKADPAAAREWTGEVCSRDCSRALWPALPQPVSQSACGVQMPLGDEATRCLGYIVSFELWVLKESAHPGVPGGRLP